MTTQIDPVLLSVLANAFEGIVREMTNGLLRSGRSSVLNTARDFSCSILTADNLLLAAADWTRFRGPNGTGLRRSPEDASPCGPRPRSPASEKRRRGTPPQIARGGPPRLVLTESYWALARARPPPAGAPP